MDFFSEGLLNLFTLSALEIILGIDNVIFIAIIIQSIPSNQRKNARVIGLSLAFILRVLMLFGASWIIKLVEPLFTIYNFSFSGRNILLIIGGVFLIGKSILEILELFDEEAVSENNLASANSKYWKCIWQIVFIDLILSFDSIITAVGMTNDLYIIIAAIIVAMLVMLVAAEPIGGFIYKYPSIKIIALCFIILVGIMLIFNGFNREFPKGYLYATMFFSIIVETINIYLQKKKNICENR